jgi:acetyltransferase-like isoleucine patch superfamily enzyme
MNGIWKIILKETASALCIVLPSFVTCKIYRMVGHKIGTNVRLSLFSYVHAEKIEIGNDVAIRPFVFIRVSQLSINSNSIVSFGTQIKGEKSFFARGNNFIGVHCLINCEEDVTMGFYSGFGPRCNIYTHGSFLPVIKGYPAKFASVVLEDYVWVGMAVTILPGTHIESNCIVNPGVVLKSRIKANTLIEVSSAAFRVLDLRRLQKFAQKELSIQYYEEMIRGFLAYCRMDYVFNAKEKSFSASDKYEFKLLSGSDVVELSYKGEPPIRYNFDTFCADHSKLRLHKKFLFYLRRRYGVILGVNYRTTSELESRIG